MNLRKVSHISFLFSLAVLLLTFTSGSGSPRTRAARGESDEVDRQARDKTPASRIVWHYVGRATSNFANGTTVVVGYFSHIDGVPEPFFNGPPSEATAFFTFRAEVSSQSLPRNGDVVPVLNNPGNFSVYFSANPNHNWSNPDSFSNDQLVATFKRHLEQLSLIGPIFTNSASAELLSSEDFTFNGEELNFRSLTPHGVTNVTTGSNNALPGSGFPVFTFPFAGHGVAVGRD